MATTRLMPLHVGKGRSVAVALSDNNDYLQNPEKTDNRELITGYECDPMTADNEFLLSKRQYLTLTGRSQGERDVIAYHLRQSFRLGEVTPEDANRIGYDLAMRFTKGRHAFIVATHIDRAHVHNHVIINSTALDCKRKFRNFIGSAFAIRRLSDTLCVENRLSIVENPKPSRGHYGKWFGEEKVPSHRENLRTIIDAVLSGCSSMEDFVVAMQTAGVEVKQGKHLAFCALGQERFVRCRSLGDDYSEAAILERIQGKRYVERKSPAPATRAQKLNLLIDIQAKLQEGKGAGYERWAKVFNLKQAAQTLIYLQEHGLTDYAELEEKAADASARFNALSDLIRQLDTRLNDNAALQKHIVNYSKTRPVYVEYRKAGYSRKFREQHEAEISAHQSAKKAFDDLGLKKLPTVASLRAEYAMVLDEKKRTYREYTQVRDSMKNLLMAKANVDRLLDMPERQQEKERDDFDR